MFYQLQVLIIDDFPVSHDPMSDAIAVHLQQVLLEERKQLFSVVLGQSAQHFNRCIPALATKYQ